MQGSWYENIFISLSCVVFFQSTRGSVDSMPITPPHPPKRPRTSRMVRRSRSLGSDKDRILNRGPGMYSRESSGFSQASTIGERRIISSAGEMQRPKERIEVLDVSAKFSYKLHRKASFKDVFLEGKSEKI